jgi:hypothetical protein
MGVVSATVAHPSLAAAATVSPPAAGRGLPFVTKMDAAALLTTGVIAGYSLTGADHQPAEHWQAHRSPGGSIQAAGATPMVHVDPRPAVRDYTNRTPHGLATTPTQRLGAATMPAPGVVRFFKSPRQ